MELADQDGRFAPHPSGGGCWDFDAVYLLTHDGLVGSERALIGA